MDNVSIYFPQRSPFPRGPQWKGRLNVTPLAEVIVAKSNKANVIGALIAAILVSRFSLISIMSSRRTRWPFTIPFGGDQSPDGFEGCIPILGRPRPLLPWPTLEDDWTPVSPFTGNPANTLWWDIRRVLDLLANLESSGSQPSVDELVDRLSSGYLFEDEIGNLYSLLVALAFVSHRWTDSTITEVLDKMEPFFAEIVDEPHTHHLMRLMFMVVRAAIIGRDPLVELDGLIEKLPKDCESEVRAALDVESLAELEDRSINPVLADLHDIVRLLKTSTSFQGALAALNDPDREDRFWPTAKKALFGAILGGWFGIHRIPSASVTYIRIVEDTQDGLETYDFADLQDLALTMVGLEPIRDNDPVTPIGPNKVDDDLYAANLSGAADAMEQIGFPDDWAVLSFCRTQGRFDALRFRRLFYLIDKKGSINPDLAAVVQDAVDEIDAHLAAGRKVVVHCHGGRSRTALILKAWKMRRDGLDEVAAHEWLTKNWEHANRVNSTFVEFLLNEWPAIIAANNTKGS